MRGDVDHQGSKDDAGGRREAGLAEGGGSGSEETLGHGWKGGERLARERRLGAILGGSGPKLRGYKKPKMLLP